jgi:hypothetical protein
MYGRVDSRNCDYALFAANKTDNTTEETALGKSLLTEDTQSLDIAIASEAGGASISNSVNSYFSTLSPRRVL